jgi:sorbitol-specific phosphotransferase system component IIA
MYTLTATIDRFERGRVVLRFEDGQELILPKRKLPSKIKEGSVLHCEFYRAEDAEKRKEQIARYLLEEILNSHG